MLPWKRFCICNFFVGFFVLNILVCCGLTHHLQKKLLFRAPPLSKKHPGSSSVFTVIVFISPPLHTLIRKHQSELVQLDGICLIERWATGAMTPGLGLVFPRLNDWMLS